MIGKIGEDAGKIWNYLDKNQTPQPAQVVRKAIQINVARFERGLGWLARENKVALSGVDDKNPIISLKVK